MSDLVLRVRLIHPAAVLPTRATPTDAGLDFYTVESAVVPPGAVARLPLGVAVGLPPGHCLVFRGRSGLGARGIAVLAGLIDPGYVGELIAVVHNAGRETWHVNPGHKVVQGTLHEVPRVCVVEAADLGETERSDRGFGSSDRVTRYFCTACRLAFYRDSLDPSPRCPACERVAGLWPGGQPS